MENQKGGHQTLARGPDTPTAGARGLGDQAVNVESLEQSANPGTAACSLLCVLDRLEQLAVHIPTTDGRELVMPRYTEPEAQQAMILEKQNCSLRSNRRRAFEAEKSSCRRTLQRDFVVQTLGVKTALRTPL